MYYGKKENRIDKLFGEKLYRYFYLFVFFIIKYEIVLFLLIIYIFY